MSASWVCHDINILALSVLEYEALLHNSIDPFLLKKKCKNVPKSSVNCSLPTGVYGFKNRLCLIMYYSVLQTFIDPKKLLKIWQCFAAAAVSGCPYSLSMTFLESVFYRCNEHDIGRFW